VDPLVLAFLLLVLAFAILAVDIFVPTGGLLLVVAAMVAGGSVLFAFRHSVNAGMWFLIAFLASVPVLVWAFIKIWPNTPLGKMIMLGLPERTTHRWSSATKVPNIHALVGVMGKAVTELLPSGYVEIEGQRFESASDGSPIELGSFVRVVRIDMGRLIVAQVDSSHAMRASVKPETASPEQLLNQSIDDLGLKSIKDAE
jgi:membrane-bound ClpP family serine protease